MDCIDAMLKMGGDNSWQAVQIPTPNKPEPKRFF